MSVYKEMKAAGVQIDNRYSDLYVPVTDQTSAILARCRQTETLHFTIFLSAVDSKPWYDISFAYEPFWEERHY